MANRRTKFIYIHGADQVSQVFRSIEETMMQAVSRVPPVGYPIEAGYLTPDGDIIVTRVKPSYSAPWEVVE